MRKWNAERGMSLVEATIILMVLSILTAVVAPSVGDYIEDARHTKAKEDIEAIGQGILRVVRDTGVPCLITGTPASGCTLATRVDTLYGANGNNPSGSAADFSIDNSIDVSSTDDDYNWKGTTNGDLVSQTDTIERQLVTNSPSYTTVAGNFTPSMNTASGVGWRGPYVTGPIGADPWGSKYQANTLFLSTANDADAGSTEGLLTGGWHKDVFVISAGPNAETETPFAASGTGSKALGDDLIFIVQGSTK